MEILASYTKHIGLQVKVSTVVSRIGYAAVYDQTDETVTLL